MSDHSLVYSQPTAMLATRNDNAIALAEQAKATALARYQVAIMRPRDPETVRTRLIRECRRPSLAKAAVYELPRGREKIRGPSVRLAEAAMRALGNVAVESVVVAETDDMRTVRVTVTDIETNMSISLDTVVRLTAERRKLREGQDPIDTRINSEGKPVYLVRVSDSEQMQQQASAVSKAMRSAIFRLLPGGLLDEAMQICADVARKGAEDATEVERKKMVDAWASIGVEPHELADYLGHPLAQSSATELDAMERLFVAIREGETTWPEVKRQKADAESDDGEERARPSKTAQVREKVARRSAAKRTEMPVHPRHGTHQGIVLHAWEPHGDGQWRSSWERQDEDLHGQIIARDGVIEHSKGPEPTDDVRAAVKWAFQR